MTLWHVWTRQWSTDFELKWDDICKNSDDDFCHRLRAARAASILTACFSLISFLSIWAAWCNDSFCFAKIGAITAFLVLLFSGVGVGLGISFGVDISDGMPGWAFILLGVVCFFSIFGMSFGCCGMCKRGGGFKALGNEGVHGQYGGWGSWRPGRRSFRSPGGLSSPNPNAVDHQVIAPPPGGFPQGRPPQPMHYPQAQPPMAYQGQPQTVYGQGMPQAPPRQGDFGV